MSQTKWKASVTYLHRVWWVTYFENTGNLTLELELSYTHHTILGDAIISEIEDSLFKRNKSIGKAGTFYYVVISSICP